jgi:S1-C subfamily serine protease
MGSTVLDLSDGFANSVERAGRSVITVNEGGRAGVSGTIWRDGLVVTAEHTIRDEQELTIQLPTAASSSATVVGRDPSTDIALLRLKGDSPAAAEFADPSQLRVGHFVLAVGRRRGQGLAASHGILSALGGTWRTWRGARIDQSLRLDLLPFAGFSGGPLVDVQGRVIGINTSGPRRSVMTIPTATVNRVVDQLLSRGRIARGFLGVALQPVRLAKVPGTSAGAARGLLVIMIEPGGPAENGGLTVGDIVLAFGDQSVAETADLQEALDPEHIGKTLKLRILRGGQVNELAVTVAERQE